MSVMWFISTMSLEILLTLVLLPLIMAFTKSATFLWENVGFGSSSIGAAHPRQWWLAQYPTFMAI